jgi:flagellar protein FlaJ
MDEKNIKILVLLFSVILIIIGYLTKDIGVFANLLIISTFLIFATFAFFEYEHYRQWKEMEDKLPNFLHDLTETMASGVPLPKAIKIVSKNDYGSLNSIVKYLSNQISWNVPVHKALDRVIEKTRRSKKLSTAFSILREAQMSGGNTVSVLTSLSESLELLKQIEKERKSILSQYTVIIYAISFIFLGVVAMINRVLLPIFASPQVAGMGGTGMGIVDPCAVCSGLSCDVCNLFAFLAYNFLGMPQEKPYYFASIFFLLSIIQAAFAGLVAGQVAEGSVRAGIKHSLILLSIVMASYLLLFRIGIIGV